jgi:hypothetical protein
MRASSIYKRHILGTFFKDVQYAAQEGIDKN